MPSFPCLAASLSSKSPRTCTTDKWKLKAWIISFEQNRSRPSKLNAKAKAPIKSLPPVTHHTFPCGRTVGITCPKSRPSKQIRINHSIVKSKSKWIQTQAMTRVKVMTHDSWLTMSLTQKERTGPNLRFHCAHHCPPGRLRDINKVNLLFRRPLFIPKFNEAQYLRFNSQGFSRMTELEVQHRCCWLPRNFFLPRRQQAKPRRGGQAFAGLKRPLSPTLENKLQTDYRLLAYSTWFQCGCNR